MSTPLGEIVDSEESRQFGRDKSEWPPRQGRGGGGFSRWWSEASHRNGDGGGAIKRSEKIGWKTLAKPSGDDRLGSCYYPADDGNLLWYFF